MYGGFETMTSKLPMLIGGQVVASAFIGIIREVSLLSLIFFLQTSSADGLMSAATTRAAGSSFAMAQAMQPLPQHRSSTLPFMPKPFIASIAASTSISVSMRGMRTSGVTVIGKP